MFTLLRKSFFSGIVLLAPIGVTLFVFNWLVVKIGGSVKEPLLRFLPETILSSEGFGSLARDMIATLIVLLAITALGFLSRYFVAKYLWNLGERFLRSVPIINTVYTSVKQIVDTFSSQNRAVFQQVVLVEFPRAGLYSIGFLTGTTKGEIQEITKEEVRNVFVPTTPNPTSGYLIMVPSKDIRLLEMTVGQGMKLIISGGAVVPEYLPAAQKFEFKEPSP